jgi:hypothetical protein
MQYHAEGNVLPARPDRHREPTESGRTLRLAARVFLGDPAAPEERKEYVAVLDAMGPRTATLVMNQPVPPGSVIVYEVPGTAIRGEGQSVQSRLLETPIGARYVIGVRN